jgi:hypothetical protein
MTETSDLLIFGLVVAARFAVPLLIPRYPLPAILAALVIDGVDQTIFQQFTSLPLEGYQGYDKALDIYYLTIAYISTLRNWSNHFAFQVSRFLFYWRLAGVALFEITHLRPLLLIFPNTFEYFFIFYEAYRLRWDPKGMSQRLVIGAAAFIWIVIKLPQEWWIHIAQLDTTDFIKETVLGVPLDTPWGEILAANLWIVPVAIAVVALVAILLRWLARRVPPADRKPQVSADALLPTFSREQARKAFAEEAREIVDAALFEKIALVALVSLIFAQVLPDVQASSRQLAFGLAVIVMINTALSHWLARRGVGRVPELQHFAAMGLVNAGLFAVIGLLLPGLGGAISIGSALFFVLLLTLIVTLYDQYRQVYLMRFAGVGGDDGGRRGMGDKDPLPSWHEGTSKASILRFVERVTAEGGPEYVLPLDRVAVFDNDGTLCPEIPYYFEVAFALDRVREQAAQHPEWREQQPFKAILEEDIEGFLAGGMRAILDVFVATHSGDTTDEFEATVQAWIASVRHPRTGRLYSEMVYQPMLELLGFLRANGFRTYIVSAGGIEFMRSWVGDVYGIPPEHVIGSTNQTKFEMQEGRPVLVRIPQVDFFDDKEGKPVGIHKFIGRRPILAFGNSDGDLQMLQWTAAGDGARFVGLVHHTDAEREWAYDREATVGSLDKALDEAREKGWTVVDMAREWRVVYPWES